MKTTLRLSLIMLLCIVVCLFVVPAAYAETVVDSGTCGAQGDNLTWTLYDNGELVIEGTGEMENYEVDPEPSSQRCSYPWNNDAIQSVIIKNGVSSIGKCAFWYCRSLESVTISESVSRIGVLAFDACNLEEVTIPGSVESIERAAFCYCPNLTSVTLLSGVTSIGDAVFYGCDHLKSMSIPDTVTSIGVTAFGACSSLTDVYYSGIEAQWNQIEIGSYNEALSFATIHFEVAPAETVVASGTCGAEGDNLTWTLDNKGTLTISGKGAMQDYYWTGTTPPSRPWDDYQDSIIELVVNDGVTALGRRAFYSIYNLQRVVLPEGIASLPDHVFCGCKNLSDINFPSSLTTLYNECLFDTGIDTLFLPTTVTTVYGHFYDGRWGAESKIETAPNHPVFSAIDGVLFTKDLSTLVMYPCCDQTTYTVPDGTVGIRGHAFAYNFTLETLRIPVSVAFIGDYAFHFNPGESPGRLHDIYYGGTQEQWQQIIIGDYNESLTSSTIHYNYITPDLVLPSDLTEIEEEAFAGDAFVYPKLSENTISIGRRAFADCPNLVYIYIPEATTSIDPNAFGNLSTLTIFGKTGSTAETFAQTHGFTFVAVS